jgi:hypothetical protein
MNKHPIDWTKKSVEEKNLKIERLYVLSPELKSILESIKYCRDHSRYSREPKCMLLEGRPGVGKTALSEFYLEECPRKEVDGCLVIPVLYVKVEVPATIMNLVSAVLAALGDPAADKGTIASKTRRLRAFLKELKVELIILDEFQHFIDRDSLKVLKTLSDWLKLHIDVTKIPMILMGMPYSHLILDARGNEQLKRRFTYRKKVEPFGWGETPKEQEGFRKFLKLVDYDLPFNNRANLAEKTMAYRLYCATNGVIFYVMELIRTAALAAIEQSLDTLDLDLLVDAYDQSLALAYPSRENPFRLNSNDLKPLPFEDEMPNLRNIKELEGARDIFSRN